MTEDEFFKAARAMKPWQRRLIVWVGYAILPWMITHNCASTFLTEIGSAFYYTWLEAGIVIEEHASIIRKVREL